MTDADDDLQQLYRQALVHDERRPSSRVRQAVLSHAQMALDAEVDPPAKPVASPPMVAANSSRWKAALLASLLLTPLVGLLVSLHQEHLPEEDRLSLPGTNSPALTQTVQPPAAAPTAFNTHPAGGETTARASKSDNEATRQHATRKAPAAERSRTINPMLADDATSRAIAASVSSNQSNVGQTTPPLVTGATAAVPTATTAAAEHQAGVAPPAPRMMSRTPQTTVLMDSKSMAPGQRSGELADLNGLFFQAIRAGKVIEVEAMLGNGVSVDSRDAGGKTALIWAAKDGNEELVKRLLARGANRELVDGEGLTALRYAQQQENNPVVKLLDRAQ